MSEILIAGDSWGCGEWGWDSNGYYVVTHKGLEQYFTDDGFTVTNISEGGIGNNTVILNLKKFLLSNPDYSGHIIWFQSDPFRDLRPYETFTVDYTTYEGLIDKLNQLLLETYNQFNSFNKKILCLGGVSKLNLKLILPFNNLVAAIPSIPELLLPDYQHAEIVFSDWYNLIDRQFSLDDLDKLLYNKQLQDSLIDYKDLFWPDGSHPNRVGHKKIFEYLIEYENL